MIRDLFMKQTSKMKPVVFFSNATKQRTGVHRHVFFQNRFFAQELAIFPIHQLSVFLCFLRVIFYLSYLIGGMNPIYLIYWKSIDSKKTLDLLTSHFVGLNISELRLFLQYSERCESQFHGLCFLHSRHSNRWFVRCFFPKTSRNQNGESHRNFTTRPDSQLIWGIPQIGGFL